MQDMKFPTYDEMSDATAVATSSEQTPCKVLDLPVATTATETTRTRSIRGDGPGAEVEAAEPFGTDLDAGDDDVPGPSMNLLASVT
jgi:hypothetical protein